MKEASKTLIGVFVVGAVALAVAAIIIFGSGRFFKDIGTFVAYFKGSVKGLNVGAPVTFRGVRIGEVKDVILIYDRRELSFNIPVIIEIDPTRFKDIAPEEAASEKERFEMLVEKGLRAQLESQSLVTGQLGVNLDFFPDKPATLMAAQIGGPGSKLREIPTVASTMQEIGQKIENLPVEQIANELFATLQGIRRIVNSPDTSGSIVALHQTLKNTDKLIARVDSQVDPVFSAIAGTLGDIRNMVNNIDTKLVRVVDNLDETLTVARTSIQEVDKTTEPAIESIRKAAEDASGALRQVRKTLKTVDDVLAERSPIRLEVSDMLGELAAAARSIRVLADYLEQNPDALLRGKGGSGGR